MLKTIEFNGYEVESVLVGCDYKLGQLISADDFAEFSSVDILNGVEFPLWDFEENKAVPVKILVYEDGVNDYIDEEPGTVSYFRALWVLVTCVGDSFYE